MPPFRLLHALPEELLQETLSYLWPDDLQSLNLASKWTHAAATPLLWREVLLTDTGTFHQPSSEADDDALPLGIDAHDDTPMLRKLLVLATRPDIARHVQIVQHSCHLAPVGIFNELPKTPLAGQTLSLDPRTTELVRRAVRDMARVHTVRIVFGHANVTDALLRCFFDKRRVKETPVRRLWLEDCRLAGGLDLSFPDHPLGLPGELDFAGLESVRFRRMPMHPATAFDGVLSGTDFNHARGGHSSFELQDGRGGVARTPINGAGNELYLVGNDEAGDQEVEEVFMGGVSGEPPKKRILHLFEKSMRWDDRIFENLAKEMELPPGLPKVEEVELAARARMSCRGSLLDPHHTEWEGLSKHLQARQRERHPSSVVAINMLHNARSTLTSLCFDWVLALPYNHRDPFGIDDKMITWVELYADLFALRFPHLRAFQYRNAVVHDTVMPYGLFLFDRAGALVRHGGTDFQLPDSLRQRIDLACLEFMEAHPNLQCLAWPMEGFFSPKPLASDIAHRVQSVVDNLGRTLVDLRVDTFYRPGGEPQTENTHTRNARIRDQRRRFIEGFAARMTKIESVKIEGGVPRDERRETLRALHRCPLSKIVLIGVSSPVGNTWGENGADLIIADSTLEPEDIFALEAEHKDAIHRLGHTRPEPLSPDYHFGPSYGWPPSPPLIHTIASHHASTVTELKFCGYKGAPVLFDPTPITSPMLAALKHFHSLRSLIMSFCLLTTFEGEPRDQEIINYWLDSRSPSSTSLVRVGTSEDDEVGAWERELNERYAPPALAMQITRQIGPFLSEEAKSRRDGVHVRASMCLGDWGGIFDMDVLVGKDEEGKGDWCLGFRGPREELEPARRRGKLVSRRWF